MVHSAIYILLIIIAYPYVIYPCLSFLISRFSRAKQHSSFFPTVTVLITAYNEIDFIKQKLYNTFTLDYPSALLKVIVITDGSTDGTDAAVRADGRAILLHDQVRKGKAAAINSAIDVLDTTIVVCTDANTMLNTTALKELVKHFQHPVIGAVAGEKRVVSACNKTSTLTEGFYWQYESKLREWDADTFSVTGAAGELYAIRTELLKAVPPDTICEDLVVSMRVIEQHKRVIYEPKAYGTENSSATIADEWKRKQRIAAGSIQFIYRFKLMQFCMQHPLAAFQLISRKLFRWLLVPYALIVLLLLSFFLWGHTDDGFIQFLCVCNFIFYGWAIAGWLLNKFRILPGLFFSPFYFLMANAAIVAGTYHYLSGTSFVLWERVKRG
ncbi:MAG: glycosyltransferase family 2 protein [Bacteroidota bacterium]